MFEQEAAEDHEVVSVAVLGLHYHGGFEDCVAHEDLVCGAGGRVLGVCLVRFLLGGGSWGTHLGRTSLLSTLSGSGYFLRHRALVGGDCVCGVLSWLWSFPRPFCRDVSLLLFRR